MLTIDIVHLDGQSGHIIRQIKMDSKQTKPFVYPCFSTIHSNNMSNEIFRQYNFLKANFMLESSTIYSLLIINILSYASHYTRKEIFTQYNLP